MSAKDWNDLHLAAGPAAVRAQILAALAANDATPSQSPPEPAAQPEQASPHPSATAGDPEWTAAKLLLRFALVYGETKVFDLQRQVLMKSAAFAGLVGKKLAEEWKNNTEKKQIDPDDVERLIAAKGVGGKERDLVERYVLLHGTATAWDMVDKKIMPKAALQMALGSNYPVWENSPDRRVIRADCLIFDPTQRLDPACHINTFTGLPIKASDAPERAQPILDLLFWVVNFDQDVFWWVAKWLAYPLQHMGAKMRSALLVHGRNQGAGKSLFFGDIHRQIYGDEYGAVVGQHQLDGSYTVWRSRKLYCVFEEIFSNATKYSHMGTVKHMITGTTHRIEKKFVDGWEEENHMNAIFLSNENQPLPVEPNDRRMMVIWPERKLDEDLKARVQACIDAGGVAAWYRWLLDLDLSGFNEFTEPPITAAKQRLIDYGLPGWEVFYRDWKAGRLKYPYTSCLTSQLYEAYKRWCTEAGEHSVLSRNKLTQMLLPFERRREDQHYLGASGSRKGTLFLIGEPGPDTTMEKWLGQCIGDFEQELRQ